jgi:ribosomal protein S12 methylthiotransferase accessory factor
MEIVVRFPGGARVDASFGPFTVRTDQPKEQGGQGAAPTPFQTFLAAVGACAGIYVLGFCRQRGIPADGIRLVQRTETDPATGLVARIGLDIEVPASFPEKYRGALVRAAEQCAIKKHLEHPPAFAIATRVAPVPDGVLAPRTAA